MTTSADTSLLPSVPATHPVQLTVATTTHSTVRIIWHTEVVLRDKVSVILTDLRHWAVQRVPTLAGRSLPDTAATSTPTTAHTSLPVDNVTPTGAVNVKDFVHTVIKTTCSSILRRNFCKCWHFFTAGFCNKFALRCLLYFPSHLKHVTTLPCKTFAADTFDFQQVTYSDWERVQIRPNEPDVCRY